MSWKYITNIELDYFFIIVIYNVSKSQFNIFKYLLAMYPNLYWGNN